MTAPAPMVSTLEYMVVPIDWSAPATTSELTY